MSMHIITRHIVTERMQRAIGAALGLPGPASREQVREVLQKNNDLYLNGLDLPVLSHTQTLSFDERFVLQGQANGR